MVLQDDAAHGHVAVLRVAAPVQDDADVVRGDAGEVGLVEDIVLAGLQLDILVHEHDAVVGIGTLFVEAVDLHLHRNVGGGAENAGEVIGLVLGQGDGGRRDHENLGLPTVGGGRRERPCVLVSGLFQDRIRNRGPSRGIVIGEGQSAVGVRRLPKVGIGVVVEAVEDRLASLGGQDKLPGNRAAAIPGLRVPDQRHGIVVQADQVESRVLDIVIVRDIREQGTGRKGQQQVIAPDAEAIGGLLRLDGNIVIGTFLIIAERRGRDAGIHIHGTRLARIELVCSVGGEGQTVVIQAEILLLIRGSLIPFRRIVHGRATGQMGLGGVVDPPDFGGSAGNIPDIPVEIDDAVLDMEGLLHIIRRHAGGIHHVHPDGIIARRDENLLVVVLGLINGPFPVLVLEHPHRDDRLPVQGKGHLVGLLVHGYRRTVGGSRRRSIGLGRMHDLFRSAREHEGGRHEDIC